jgi:DNA polymerase III subunit delta
MRYLNINSLKKHFENPSFDKIRIYLIVIADSYEREKIFSLILKKNNLKKFTISKFSNDFKLSQIINTFQSPSLLGGEPLIIIDDIETLSKEDMNNLNTFVKNNDPYLIIGCQSKQQSSVLYSTIEKKGLVFDLTGEKIWEKEKRLANFIVEKCIKAQKNISSIVIDDLFEKVGLDLALIEQEIEKLITYTCDKKTIELDDVKDMCPINCTQSIWQMAEEIVWEEIKFDNISIDANFFHQLISAIRFQLEMGYKIASLIEDKKVQDLSSYFPKIYPRTLEKKKEIAIHYKSAFYKKALEELFKIDLLSKTINFDFSYLFDLLKTKLVYLSTYDLNNSS